jgi:hypothetical protein
MPIVLLLLVVVIALAFYLDRDASHHDKAKDPRTKNFTR